MRNTDDKAKRALTRKSFKLLDKKITLLDCRHDYYLDTLMRQGVGSIGELVKFTALYSGKNEQDFSLGDDTGGGCSTFDAVTPQGEHILGRNFDFRVAPCFVLWTHPQNHYASIAVVDGNFLTFGNKRNIFNGSHTAQLLLAPYCCVDGINEKGLAIAVLQIKAKATKQQDTSKKNITTTAMIRCVLDTCADVDEAVELFKKYNMHDSLYCAYHYQLSDANGRSLVIEYIDNKMYVYEKSGEKYGVEGSIFDGDGTAQTYATNVSAKKDTGSYKVEQHGSDRAEAMIKALNDKNGILTERQAMDLLRYVRLDYDHPRYPWFIRALWSAVYNSGKKTLTLAANAEYERVYTFAIDKPLEALECVDLGQSNYPDGSWEYL